MTKSGTSNLPFTVNLIEWVNARAFGSDVPNQGQIQTDTITGYLLGLRSYHVDQNYPNLVFESFQLDRMI